MNIMNTLITAISMIATVGLSACGLWFFGSWVEYDFEEFKHHNIKKA